MASKRAKRRKACTGKQRYAGKRAAVTAVNSMARVRGRHGRPEFVRPYPCDLCGGWHLTKSEKRGEEA